MFESIEISKKDIWLLRESVKIGVNIPNLHDDERKQLVLLWLSLEGCEKVILKPREVEE